MTFLTKGLEQIIFFVNNFKNKFKKLLYLSELWQEVHAGRTPGRKEVNEHRLATGDDVRKIPGGQGAQRACLHRETRKRGNILEYRIFLNAKSSRF